MDYSILAKIGNAICWIFKPQGWGNWQATVASVTGLVAKENIVGTMGILYGGGDATVYQTLASKFTEPSGLSFLLFNLLCAPCFAAMGAIKREMNSAKWFWFAIGYQCGLAYLVSLVVYQIGVLITAGTFGVGTVVAFLIIAFFLYMLFRPNKNAQFAKIKTNLFIVFKKDCIAPEHIRCYIKYVGIVFVNHGKDEIEGAYISI